MSRDKDIPVKLFTYSVCGSLIVLLAFFIKNGCTDPNRSRFHLEKAGYLDVVIMEGYQINACQMKDTYATGFTALSPEGAFTSGTVCCPLFTNSCRIELHR